ncbi:hypothetical protein F4678DRAFT_30881 [Xylaria arbuscula]|nr:hypothetical protein F4678DRAFT_30881 [Xylaria arbuscula]
MSRQTFCHDPEIIRLHIGNRKRTVPERRLRFRLTSAHTFYIWIISIGSGECKGLFHQLLLRDWIPDLGPGAAHLLMDHRSIPFLPVGVLSVRIGATWDANVVSCRRTYTPHCERGLLALAVKQKRVKIQTSSSASPDRGSWVASRMHHTT